MKLLVVLMCVFSLHAQALFTGTTGGKNNGAVLLFGTGQRTGNAYSANNWGMVTYGATNHLDLFVGAGDMVASGQHFPFMAFGNELAFPTAKILHCDIAVYNVFSFPFANMERSATAFGNSGVIASKTFPLGKFPLTPYSGYILNYGLGPEDRTMAMPDIIRQIPLGIAFPFGTKSPVGFMAEYDYGRMQGIGVALTYNFHWLQKIN